MESNTFSYMHVGIFAEEDAARLAGERMAAEMDAIDIKISQSRKSGRWKMSAERRVNMNSASIPHDQARVIMSECGGVYDGGFTKDWLTP